MEPDPILPYARPADSFGALTARGAAAIVCRLIAIWLLVQAVQGTVASLSYLVMWLAERPGRPGQWQYDLIGLFAVLGPVIAAWVLWSASGWISRRVVPDDAPIGPVDAIGLQPLITVGLIMAGAWTAALTIRDLVSAAVVTSQSHSTFALWWHDENWLRAVVSDTIVLTLSAWLIMGGRGLVNLIHWARTAGHHRSVADQSTVG